MSCCLGNGREPPFSLRSDRATAPRHHPAALTGRLRRSLFRDRYTRPSQVPREGGVRTALTIDPIAASEIDARLAAYGFDANAISTDVYVQAREILVLFEGLLNAAQTKPCCSARSGISTSRMDQCIRDTK